MDRIYLQEREPIHFKFEQNQEDFIVDEIGLEWKGSGNFAIYHIKKIEMTTWDMVAAFAEYLNINAEKIGYAGLKDKHATTTQYISIESRYEKELKKFRHPQIKILKVTRHNRSIRMGDLIGNRFKINLFEVNQIQAGQIEKLARRSEKLGLPNYFGYQRFGRDADSVEQAKKLIAGEIHMEDAKVKSFLISIYQSDLFNKWLCERVEISRKENDGKFMLLPGDLYFDTKGKLVTPKQIPQKDFLAQKIIPTGLLCGRNVYRSRERAAEIEAKYDDGFLYEKGLRRAAIIFPQDVQMHYTEGFEKMNIAFTLPKGSYATVFLENIASKMFKAKKLKKPQGLNKRSKREE